MGLQQAIESASDPAGVMDRILGEVLALVPSAEGAAVLLCTEPSSLTFAASVGNLTGATGITAATSGTLAGIALRTGVTQRSADARVDSRVDPDLVKQSPILSLVCVPLSRDSVQIGVLMITSTKVSMFSLDDEFSLAGLAPFVSTVIGAAIDLESCTTELLDIGKTLAIASIGRGHLGGTHDAALARSAFVANVVCPGTALESASRDRVESVLAGTGPTIVLQPIVSLASGQVVSVEALSRFSSSVHQAPDVWFAEAALLGLGLPFELRAIENALALLGGIPYPVRMAVNASPETFCSAGLVDLLLTSDPRRIVVELTEHVDTADFPALHRACKRLRAIGAEVAIDDTGTGYASLSLVLEVAPEIIKLDRELCANIDVDPVRRALASALITFGAEIGANVVAEGIETVAELDALRHLGIRFGQGYYLARPGTVEDLKLFVANASRQLASNVEVL